jgi:hypothetical protein
VVLRSDRFGCWEQCELGESLVLGRHEPMKKYRDRLILGKGSAFVKSHLSRLPRTDEVWEADIQPISVRDWNTRHHGELWLGMVLTQWENLHLAVLASLGHG